MKKGLIMPTVFLAVFAPSFIPSLFAQLLTPKWLVNTSCASVMTYSPLQVDYTGTVSGILSYSWTIGTGNDVAFVSATDVSHCDIAFRIDKLHLLPGSILVNYTFTDSSGTSTYTTIVPVSSLHFQPVANFSPHKVSIAAGSSVQFISRAYTTQINPATSTPYTITSKYWTFGDGTSATGDSLTHVFTTPGTYQIYHQVTDNIGCKSETFERAIKAEIFVY